MRKIIAAVVFVVASSQCMAQEAGPPPISAQKIIEGNIGALAVQNAQLMERVDQLTRQVADLRKQLEIAKPETKK